jgi:hypothetical protein
MKNRPVFTKLESRPTNGIEFLTGRWAGVGPFFGMRISGHRDRPFQIYVTAISKDRDRRFNSS